MPFGFDKSKILLFARELTLCCVFQTRVLKSDFARYNLDEEENEELDQEDNGWKIIHTDVFRYPVYKNLFCAILGMLNSLPFENNFVISFHWASSWEAYLLTLSQTSPGFYVSAVQVFWKHWGKRRNCL